MLLKQCLLNYARPVWQVCDITVNIYHYTSWSGRSKWRILIGAHKHRCTDLSNVIWPVLYLWRSCLSISYFCLSRKLKNRWPYYAHTHTHTHTHARFVLQMLVFYLTRNTNGKATNCCPRHTWHCNTVYNVYYMFRVSKVKYLVCKIWFTGAVIIWFKSAEIGCADFNYHRWTVLLHTPSITTAE
jgi:hypothetical protein